MKIDQLSDIEPGNRLAEDIFNFQGLLLLKKDTMLSEKNIRMLKSWGVSEVQIKGNVSDHHDNAGPSSEELRGLVRKKLQERFGNIDDDPIMQEIMATALNLMMKRAVNHEK